MKWFFFLSTLFAQLPLLLAEKIQLVQIPLQDSDKKWNSQLLPELKKQDIITLQRAPLKTSKKLVEALKSHTILFDNTNSPIFYNSKEWSAKVSGAFSLLEEAEVKPSPQPPTCSWVRLTPKKGSGLYLYNVSFSNQSKSAVEEAVEIIIRNILSRDYIDEPVVISSNLNVQKFPDAYKRLIHFTDLREQHLTANKLDTPLIIHPLLSIASSAQLKAPPTAIAHTLTWNPADIESAKDWRFFKETVLDKEIGDGNGIVVKWIVPEIHVRIIGGSKSQREKIQAAVRELNSALENTSIKLTISDQTKEHEIRCYIGTIEELKPVIKKEKVTPPFDYAGFATVFWYTDTAEIVSSVVLIPTDRSDEKIIAHVIREEITQALGLPGDNTVIPESITYSRGLDHGKSTTLSREDKAALRLLYTELEPKETTKQVKAKFDLFWEKADAP